MKRLRSQFPVASPRSARRVAWLLPQARRLTRSRVLAQARLSTRILWVLPAALAPLPAVHATAVTTGVAQETDTIVGAGNAGPYYLARTAVVPLSESIRVNGAWQMPELDYKLNPADGSVTFARPLQAGELVTARYCYDMKSSHTTLGGIQNSALDVPLLGIGSTTIHMLGGLATPQAGHAAAGGVSSVGMDVQQLLGKQGSVDTQLLLAPQSAWMASAAQDAPPIWSSQQGLAKVSGNYNLAQLRLSGAYLAAGRDAATGLLPKGTAPGTEQSSLALTGAVTKAVSVDAGRNSTAAPQGTGSSDDHVKLSVALSPGASVVLSHTDNAVEKAGAETSKSSSTVTVQDKLKGGATVTVDAGADHAAPAGAASTDADHLKLGLQTANGATIVASQQTTSTGSGASATDHVVTDVGVQAPVSKVVKLNADVNRTTDSSGAATLAATTGVTVTPQKGLVVGLTEARTQSKDGHDSATHDVAVQLGTRLQADARVVQASGGSSGDTADGTLSVKAKPTATLAVAVSGQAHQDPTGLASQSGGVSTTYQPSKVLQVAGDVGKQQTRTDDVSTNVFSVGLTPQTGWALNLKSSGRRSTQDGLSGQRSVALALGPTNKVKLNATYGERYAGKDADDVGLTDRAFGTDLAVDPAKTIHFGAGFHQDLAGAILRRDRSVDTKLAPGAGLSLSGQYIVRTVTAGDLPDTATVTVGFHRTKLLGVDGSYVQNPTDARGNVSAALQRSVTLTSLLGPLNFSGKLSENDPAGPAPAVLLREYGVGIQFTKQTQLTGSFQSGSQPAAGASGVFLYKLGFAHKLGDMFSLSLDGQVSSNKAGVDGVRDGVKTDSQARVGVNAHW